jgi:purine-nucleoside phosphorylase
MLYIITALKPEAQAFIEKYKLQKSKLGDFRVFTNNLITLIVSGLGVQNATLATQTLINHFDITDEDIYINVGICAASQKYKIGELIEIDAICYNNQTYIINEKHLKTIECLDAEAHDEKYEIADMESFGFYDAVVHSPAIKNIFMFKVVSDHFEPHKVSKDGTKSLIFNAIDVINSLIKTKVCS